MHIGCMYRTRVPILGRGCDGLMTVLLSLPPRSDAARSAFSFTFLPLSLHGHTGWLDCRLSPLYLCRCFACDASASQAFFCRAAGFSCFKLHAHAGQWRRNPAVRTRVGSRGPPFPPGASLTVRGAGCVDPSVGRLCWCPWPVAALPDPSLCPPLVLQLFSLCFQTLASLAKRLSTGLPPKDVDIRPAPARRSILILLWSKQENPFESMC
jgi:hypothetical protein